MQERIERIALRNRFFSGEYWEFLELALGTSKLMCTYVVLVVYIKVIVLQLVRTVVCFSYPLVLVRYLVSYSVRADLELGHSPPYV